MRSKTVILSVLAVLVGSMPPAYAEIAKPHYALADTMPLAGPVRWDFLTLDAAKQYLFVARDDRVDVLNLASKKIIASIDGLDGVHGVALAADADRGFISEGKANRVTVFDLATLKPILTVRTGKKPDAIVYDRKTGRVFVADGGSDDLTVIDAKKAERIGTVKLDGAPEFAVVDGDGKLYINLEDKSAINVVDTERLKVVGHYNLTPDCERPTGLALDKADNLLFSVCANRHMVVVDALTGKIRDTLDIGSHPDAARFDAGTGLAFSSNGGDGTLTVVGKGDGGHYKVLQSVPTKISARTMALDPETHDIYLSAAETEGFDPPTAQHPEPRPHISAP
ncbi:MAG TPA: YncE family protein [Alphaproteobacteria bacterium]|nr:YncE family protein [Alphaproteobacteria bacterium]